MLDKIQYSASVSKLLEYISSTHPHGNLSEDATDLKAIAELIKKPDLTLGEEKLRAYLFERHGKPLSMEPIALIDLALAIIEPTNNPVSEIRILTAAVKHICANSSVNVKIVQGEAPSIKVVANSKRNASKMVTRESGDTLYIEQAPTVIMGSNGSSKFRVEGRVGQVITGGTIVNGSMNIDMTGNDIAINGQSLNEMFESEYVEVTVPKIDSIHVHGSSDVAYLGFSQRELSASVSGSGEILLAGDVKTLSATVTGSGDIYAKELIANAATLTVTGSGSIKSYVKDNVRAVVTGSGDIKVLGDPPSKSKQVTGSGKIKFN